ncbi:hypothetical protein EAF04_008916 [Stromatinia cepivora]|nr:hypothetical protein EAF04_008916 [Stromatinia cepivora]
MILDTRKILTNFSAKSIPTDIPGTIDAGSKICSRSSQPESVCRYRNAKPIGFAEGQLTQESNPDLNERRTYAVGLALTSQSAQEIGIVVSAFFAVGDIGDSKHFLSLRYCKNIVAFQMDTHATTPLVMINQVQAQVNKFQDQFKMLTPGGGAYMNEATFDNPTWKEDYYGTNYDELLKVKLSHDPNFVLYAHTSVGSDLVTVASDGRVCRDL